MVALIKFHMRQTEQFWSQPLFVGRIRMVDRVAYSQENLSEVKTVTEKREEYCWETMDLSRVFHVPSCLMREVLNVVLF